MYIFEKETLAQPMMEMNQFNEYNRNLTDREREVKPPKNRLPLSITALVVGVTSICTCCIGLFLGALAVVFATQSKTKYNREDYVGAESSSQVAYVLSIVSLFVSALSILIYIIMLSINGIGDVSDLTLGIESKIIDHLY